VDDFLATVAAEHPGAAETAFARLTRSYLAQRFGDRRRHQPSASFEP
jgi:hypothetical protein